MFVSFVGRGFYFSCGADLDAVYRLQPKSLMLHHKQALLRQYQKQRVMLKNLQEAFSPLPYKDQTAEMSLSAMIFHFNRAINQLKGEMIQVCKEDFAEQHQRLTAWHGPPNISLF